MSYWVLQTMSMKTNLLPSSNNALDALAEIRQGERRLIQKWWEALALRIKTVAT